MSALSDYVMSHADRNSCRCGKCIIGNGTVNEMPAVHTVNMYYFDVCSKDNPVAEDFLRLSNEHVGDFEVNPFDGKEHSYIEIGAWIGDQGLGMMYMALGEILGLWKILHPGKIFNVNDPRQKDLADNMAGMGMISIVPSSAAASEKK